MERQVTRVVTPGTLTDAALLDEKRDNLLLALQWSKATLGLAWITLASGDFRVLETTPAQLASELTRLQPAEILVADGTQERLPAGLGVSIKPLPPWHFDTDSAARALCRHFGTQDLAGFGAEGLDPALGAAGALLEYCRATQGSALAHVLGLSVERESAYLRLDAATRRNLEITETLRGEPAPTLLSLLDTCATSMGSRYLRHVLHHPLRDRAAADARLEATAALAGTGGNGPWRSLQQTLGRAADVERITARIALSSARPRDLTGLRETLRVLPELCAQLAGIEAARVVQLAGDAAAAPCACSICSPARSRTSPARWCAKAA